VADLLTADDFAYGPHRRLWTLIAEMAAEGGAIDFVTIGQRDQSLEQLAMELPSETPSWKNARTYGEHVARRAIERRVIAAGQKIAGLRGDAILAEARRLLAECEPRGLSGVRHIKAVVREAWTELQVRYERDAAITGLETGIPWLDDMTGGLQPGDVFVLGARPSAGKTALMLQIAAFVARNAPALIFSAEMTDKALANRLMASASRVSLKAIRSPVLIEEEGWTSLGAAIPQISSTKLFIDSSDGITCEMMSARARQVKEQHGLSLIAIDYLQLLRLPKADRHDLAVGAASRAIKGMAKQLDVPVILLSQLNRDGANKRPNVAELRQSGDIEQDADLIGLLYRPDDDKPERELILAKQRNGETGSQWFDFDGPRQTFNACAAPERPTNVVRTSGYDGRARAAGR
jgi:replicative DNA helicase